MAVWMKNITLNFNLRQIRLEFGQIVFNKFDYYQSFQEKGSNIVDVSYPDGSHYIG